MSDVSDEMLKASIREIVAQAELASTTKSDIRQALQGRFPQVDLLLRKNLVVAEIAAAVEARVRGV